MLDPEHCQDKRIQHGQTIFPHPALEHEEPGLAAAGVIVDPVNAGAAVETGGAGTLVHVHLTAGARVAGQTLAQVTVHLYNKHPAHMSSKPGLRKKVRTGTVDPLNFPKIGPNILSTSGS